MQEWVNGGSALLAFVAILGTMVKMNHDFNRKVSRVYERMDIRTDKIYTEIDKNREKMEDKYILRRECALVHQRTQSDISEIKADNKEIKKDIKALEVIKADVKSLLSKYNDNNNHKEGG